MFFYFKFNFNLIFIDFNFPFSIFTHPNLTLNRSLSILNFFNLPSKLFKFIFNTLHLLHHSCSPCRSNFLRRWYFLGSLSCDSIHCSSVGTISSMFHFRLIDLFTIFFMNLDKVKFFHIMLFDIQFINLFAFTDGLVILLTLFKRV